MPSYKASSADNQQERLAMAFWITGFVDGEGSFLVSIFRNKTTKSGWQIFPEFIITQGAKSLRSLITIKKYFGCGQVYVNRRADNHQEDLYRFCVRSLSDLLERIIPFFDEYRLKTAKTKDYKKFRRVVKMMKQGSHLTKQGREKIRAIALTMNRKGNK